MRYPTAFALAVAALAPAALANDTTAELATGGLIFVTTDEVEMRSEKLFISTEQVRVTYEFFNKSDKDVTTLVAFPLPEIRIATQDDNVAVPSEEPNNVFGFKTTVDGVPVKAEVEQRVTAMGVDRTQYLRALGIPLDPHLPATDQALDKLPQDKWPELVALGLAEIAEYDDTGKGMKKHLEARWGLATTYYWKQTFPAKKQIVIHHQYVPSVGGSAQTDLGAPNQATIPGYSVAVKTGTATTQGISDDQTVASMAGFLPASNPQYVILVKIDRPQATIFGGTAAAPVWKLLAQELMWHYSVPPDLPTNQTGSGGQP